MVEYVVDKVRNGAPAFVVQKIAACLPALRLADGFSQLLAELCSWHQSHAPHQAYSLQHHMVE
jgi:hypothetical protein